MKRISRNVRLTNALLMTYSTAADQWLMVICLIAAFGRRIPWYIWTLFALELIVVVARMIKAKDEGILP